VQKKKDTRKRNVWVSSVQRKDLSTQKKYNKIHNSERIRVSSRVRHVTVQKNKIDGARGRKYKKI